MRGQKTFLNCTHEYLMIKIGIFHKTEKFASLPLRGFLLIVKKCVLLTLNTVGVSCISGHSYGILIVSCNFLLLTGLPYRALNKKNVN